MASTLPTLPVEIWLLVLEHALILNPFFSTDPVSDSTENRYNAAIDHWLNTQGLDEETWQVVRRVCRSWKKFVDRPDIRRRFGRMEDVFTGFLSVSNLMKARRIKAPVDRYFRSDPSIFMGRIGLAQPIRDDGDFAYKVKIMTHVTAPVIRMALEHRPSVFPHLKALHLILSAYPIEERWAPKDFANISKNFPSIVFLYLRMDIDTLYFQDIFHLQSLRTLVIVIAPFYPLVQSLSFDQWSFPSLLHLKIGTLRTTVMFRSLIGALSRLGRGLKVLDVEIGIVNVEIGIVDEDIDVIHHIWSDCPKLESLRFPLSLLVGHPPTHDRHPLRYLVNSERDPQGSCWSKVVGSLPTDFKTTLISFCNALPSLLVLRDSHDWTSILFRDREGNTEAATNFRLELDEDCCRQMVETAVQIKALGMSVRFEDVNEKTWGEDVRLDLVT